MLWMLLVLCVSSSLGSGHDGAEEDVSISVAKLNFDYVSVPLIVTMFVFILVIVKIIYHRLTVIAELLPESCALIIMGLALGGLLLLVPNGGASDSGGNVVINECQNTTVQENLNFISFLIFDKQTFFLYLLPPIILEAAYSLRDRAFIENLGTILLFAVIGTVLNTAFISAILYGLSGLHLFSVSVSLLQCLVFGALIAAVDPVAVLAIFEEVGVNKMLYFMVFGESLLNDAVTVVLYNLMAELILVDETSGIGVTEMLLGFAAFLCVSCGAMAIGFAWGFLCAFVTKFTSDIRIVEPAIVFATAYAAYLCAELVEFSGIISIICCGLIQAQYAMENLSSKSFITVQYATKTMAQIMESIIFIILGVMLLNHDWFWHYFNWEFAVMAVVICFAVRFLVCTCLIVFIRCIDSSSRVLTISVVIFLTTIVNWFTYGIRRITFQEQLIMSYGGLRGAVSFSLAFALDKSIDPDATTSCQIRGMFLGATYIVILFTVFVQGTTMKPLVHLLKIRLAHSGTHGGGFRIFREFHRGVVQNSMAGIEEIIGHRGTHYWKSISRWISSKFIRPALQTSPTVAGGRGLLAMNEQLKFESAIGASTTSGATLSPGQTARRLSFLDKSVSDGSDIPNSYANAMLNADESDGKHKVRKRTKKIGLDTATEIANLRSIIDNPLHRRIHYTNRDLRVDVATDLVNELRHRAHCRQAFHDITTYLESAEARTQAPAVSAMFRHAMPMARIVIEPPRPDQPNHSDGQHPVELNHLTPTADSEASTSPRELSPLVFNDRF